MWWIAEFGGYQSPGNADSTYGSHWSWTIGHAAAYRDGGHADLYSVSDYIGCGGSLSSVDIKVLVMLIVLVVVFGHGDGHAAAFRDGGQFDMRIFLVFLITLVVAER